MAVPTAVTIPSRVATAGVAITFAAAPTTPTAITWMPGDILVALNTDGSNAQTVTIVSNPTIDRTTTTIAAESLASGAYHIFPRFGAQDDGTLTVSASDAAVKFARISTRAQPS